MDRRTFIAASSTALIGGMLGGISPSQAKASLSVRPTIGGPLVTPNGTFFLYSQLRYPAKTPTGVQIDGLVTTPQRYSLDDLAKVPQVKKTLTLECYVNTAGGALIFNTEFEGAPLPALFEKGRRQAGGESRAHRMQRWPSVRAAAHRIDARGNHDGRQVRRRTGADGARQPLYPAVHSRRRRQPSSQMGDPHHAVEKEAVEHPAPPMAGFLKPTPPTVRAPLSGVTLTGYAYTGVEKVGKVEVSTDNGTTWRVMPLPPQPDQDVWITWDLTFVPPEKGFYVLKTRATSASGRKQDIPGVIAVEVV